MGRWDTDTQNQQVATKVLNSAPNLQILPNPELSDTNIDHSLTFQVSKPNLQPLRDPAARVEILRLLSDGVKVNEIARKFNVTPGAVSKFKRFYGNAAMAAAAQIVDAHPINDPNTTDMGRTAAVASLIPAAAFLQERLHKRYADIDRGMQGAGAKDIASLSTADARLMQLHAELTGSINRSPQVTDNRKVVVIMPSLEAAGSAPAVIDIVPEQ